MIGAMIGWCLEAAEDPAAGVNATRVDVPRAAGEEPPPEVDCYSQNESAWVARGELPPEVLTRRPVLLFRQAGEYEAPFLPEEPSPATIDVAVLVAANGDASHVDLRQLEQLLRTTLRVLSVAANAATAQDDLITRDGVEFAPTGRVTFLPPTATPGTPMLIGALVAFTGHDPWVVGGGAA